MPEWTPRSPRLVRRRGHHLAGTPGISVATDHDRPPGELGVAQHFDGREELVEVDVQDPRLSRVQVCPAHAAGR